MVLQNKRRDRAYALACLERWEECLEVAGEAEKWVLKDRPRKSVFGYDYTPFKLLPIVAALARHFVGPAEETRKEARMKLSLRSIKARDHSLHISGLIYLFNLRDRHRELLA